MLTAAQRSRATAAEALLIDTVRGLTLDQTCDVLARVLTGIYTPDEMEQIGNAINRRAWESARMGG